MSRALDVLNTRAYDSHALRRSLYENDSMCRVKVSAGLCIQGSVLGLFVPTGFQLCTFQLESYLAKYLKRVLIHGYVRDKLRMRAVCYEPSVADRNRFRILSSLR